MDACRNVIASLLFCHISLVPRLANAIAHKLAATAVSQASIMYRDYVPPDSYFFIVLINELIEFAFKKLYFI